MHDADEARGRKATAVYTVLLLLLLTSVALAASFGRLHEQLYGTLAAPVISTPVAGH